MESTMFRKVLSTISLSIFALLCIGIIAFLTFCAFGLLPAILVAVMMVAYVIGLGLL